MTEFMESLEGVHRRERLHAVDEDVLKHLLEHDHLRIARAQIGDVPLEALNEVIEQLGWIHGEVPGGVQAEIRIAPVAIEPTTAYCEPMRQTVSEVLPDDGGVRPLADMPSAKLYHLGGLPHMRTDGGTSGVRLNWTEDQDGEGVEYRAWPEFAIDDPSGWGRFPIS